LKVLFQVLDYEGSALPSSDKNVPFLSGTPIIPWRISAFFGQPTILKNIYLPFFSSQLMKTWEKPAFTLK
jgi:hypothetical protein